MLIALKNEKPDRGAIVLDMSNMDIPVSVQGKSLVPIGVFAVTMAILIAESADTLSQSVVEAARLSSAVWRW